MKATIALSHAEGAGQGTPAALPHGHKLTEPGRAATTDLLLGRLRSGAPRWAPVQLRFSSENGCLHWGTHMPEAV